MKKNAIGLFTLSLIGAGCSTQKSFEEKLSKTLKERPEILYEVIKEHPSDFLEVLQNAVKKSQESLAQKRQEQERQLLENAMSSPLKPMIRNDDAYHGRKDAPLTLVEYVDFECPYCQKSYHTVEALKKRYGGALRVVYKHMPLDFHPHGLLAAKYFEALRMQDRQLALKFHDEVFQDQQKIKKGDKYLSHVSRKLGANMKKLKRDLHTKEVQKRIDEDSNEAKSFGLMGTPGFVLNGVPVRGAYPEDYFVRIVNELKQRKLVNL